MYIYILKQTYMNTYIFNQIITIFNYIYMLLLKSDILQTECLAFPGKDECKKCNLKTIYSPSHHQYGFIIVRTIETSRLKS